MRTARLPSATPNFSRGSFPHRGERGTVPLSNAGGKWVDHEVVVDRNWVSSRKPADIPAFNVHMIELFGQHVRRPQAQHA